MAEQAAKEPTMEEILASIRRIISEDGEPVDQEESAEAAAETDLAEDNVADTEDVVFDTTEAVVEELDAINENEAAPEAAVEEEAEDEEHLLSVEELLADDPILEEFDDIDAMDGAEEVTFDDLDPESEPEAIDTPEPAPEPSPEPQSFAAEETEMPATQRYQDTTLTEDATADKAAGALGKLISSMDLGGENTIEGLVRELLKPMIKEWLDANLPQIVEDKVEAEVQRIAKMVR